MTEYISVPLLFMVKYIESKYNQIILDEGIGYRGQFSLFIQS